MATGRNHTRRRRVILDEVVQQSGGLTKNSEDQHSNSKPLDLANSYSTAATRRGQLKTTDLIPKRPLPVGIVIGMVLVFFALINFLARYAPQWELLSADAVQTLGYSGVGTLSAWFSSLLLMITGMASLQIYGMRKHRYDDYSGHYRIWLFLAVLFVFASVNCVVDFKSIFLSLANSMGFGGGNSIVILLVAKIVALTALVVRGILEIRASKAALCAVVIVWVAYASAIVSQIPGVQERLVQNEDFVIGNFNLIAVMALFLAVLFYSRFVYLHANELIRLESQSEQSSPTAEFSENQSRQPAELTSEAKIENDGQSADTIIKLQSASEVRKSSNKLSRKARKQQRKAA